MKGRVQFFQGGFYAEPENINDIENKVNLFINLKADELKKSRNSRFTFASKYFDRKMLA